MGNSLPRRGFVGLSVGTKAVAGGGLPVRAVAPGSAAERAGIRPGDVLVRLREKSVTDVFEVRTLLRSLHAGDSLAVGVRRDEKLLSLSMTIAPFPLERHDGANVELGTVDVGMHRLRAIALIPKGPVPHPVVYYLPGAHWASEEYPANPEHPVPALLGALARAGFASVRVERSGLGDSEGPPCTRVDFATELAGYRAGLRFVGTRPWVDPERVFILGHSLGAMIAPLLARETRPAGVACFAASALPISTALIGALRRHARAVSPSDPAALQRTEQIVELIDLVVTRRCRPDEVFRARPELCAVAPEHFAGDQAYHRVVTFYHQLERADVAGAWRTLECPTLFMHGERDIVCSAEDSQRLAELAGRAAFVSLPGVDHQMSDQPGSARPVLAPAVSATLIDWLRAIPKAS